MNANMEAQVITKAIPLGSLLWVFQRLQDPLIKEYTLNHVRVSSYALRNIP